MEGVFIFQAIEPPYGHPPPFRPPDLGRHGEAGLGPGKHRGRVGTWRPLGLGRRHLAGLDPGDDPLPAIGGRLGGEVERQIVDPHVSLGSVARVAVGAVLLQERHRIGRTGLAGQ